MSHSEKVDPARRRFLCNTLAVSAGAAVVGVAVDAGATTTQAAATEAKSQQGYHETRHIRDYYRTAAL